MIEKIGIKLFLKNRSRGLMIGTIIGFLWLFYGASFLSSPSNIIILILGIIISIPLIYMSVLTRKKSKSCQNPTKIQRDNNRKRRLYFFANVIIEIILLNLVYFYCTKNHFDKSIIFALTIVVGLHFIPMAFFMKIKQYFICSAIMILTGILFLMINNATNNATLILAQSFLNAFALWLTVALSIKEVYKNNFQIEIK